MELKKYLKMSITRHADKRMCFFVSSLLNTVLSGDLEITVDFLKEIDKLVQLIESPIFACRLTYNYM